MKPVARFLVTAICVVISAYILPGIGVDSFWSAIVVAAILGLLNAFVKPVLIFFSIPVTIVTLGLFLFVINGFTVWLTSRIVPGFHVDTFWWAVLFSIVLSIINSFMESILGLKDKEENRGE